MERKKIVYRAGTGEIVEKKSRFIADISPVRSEEEAMVFIAEIRKKYWDARHHCTAFVIGDNNEITRAGDDGEPAGTAGRPMLEVLLGNEIHNVCAVVTRYFGGTLLGTGGLVRAYSAAVKEGLKASVIVEQIRGRRILFSAAYTELGKLQYLLNEAGAAVENTDYSDKVTITVLAPESERALLEHRVTDGLSGRVEIRDGGEAFYASEDGRIILF